MPRTFRKPRHWLALVAPAVVLAAGTALFVSVSTAIPWPLNRNIRAPIDVTDNENDIVHIDISPNGKLLAWAAFTSDYTVKHGIGPSRVFRLLDGESVFQTDVQNGGTTTVWNEDGSVLLISTRVEGVLWDVRDWTRIGEPLTVNPFTDSISGTDFQENSNLLWTKMIIGSGYLPQTQPPDVTIESDITSTRNHRTTSFSVFDEFQPFDISVASMDHDVRLAVSPYDRYAWDESSVDAKLSDPVVKVLSIRNPDDPEPTIVTQYEIPLPDWNNDWVKVKLTPDGQYLGVWDAHRFRLVRLIQNQTMDIVHTVQSERDNRKFGSAWRIQMMDASLDSQYFSYSLQDRVEVFHIPSQRVIFSRIFDKQHNFGTSLDPAGKYLAVYHPEQKQIRFHPIPQS